MPSNWDVNTSYNTNIIQVYMKGEETPRCLREWSPHQGKPISSIIFLDDYSQYNANSSIWKYAVTGCQYNTELKVIHF